MTGRPGPRGEGSRRLLRVRISAGWLFPIGLALIVAAAVPGAMRFQEANDSATAAEAPPESPKTPRPGDPATYAGWGEADFPHDFHIDDLEIECADCHHETDAARLVMPHDEYFDDFWIDCSICHKSDEVVGLDPQDCHDCHPAAPRNSGDETLSAKVVIHLNCWDCHDEGTGSEASENCLFCHSTPEPSR